MDSDENYKKWLKLEKDRELAEDAVALKSSHNKWAKIVEEKHMIEITDMRVGAYKGECILYGVDGLKLIRDGEVIDIITLIQCLEDKVNAFIEETHVAQEYAPGGPRYEEGETKFSKGKLAQELADE